MSLLEQPSKYSILMLLFDKLFLFRHFVNWEVECEENADKGIVHNSNSVFGDVGEHPARRHETLAIAVTLDDMIKECMHKKELKVFVKELC